MSDFIAGPITDPLTQRLTPASTTLVDDATINLNASVADVFVVTIGGNRTLAAPTEPKGGQLLTIAVKQGGGGAFSLAFDSVYKGTEGIVLASPAGAVTVLQFLCQPTGTGFEYLLVSCSTSAGGFKKVGPVTIASGTNNISTAVGAAFNGKPVFVSFASSVGAIHGAKPVVFKGEVTGGNCVVTLIDSTAGTAIAAASNVTLNVLIDAR